MKQDVALVLSSGGARGIAHIGVLEELESQGYRVTSIAGTSMGSVVGGVYALGKLNEYKELLLQTTRMDILKFLDLTIGHGGLVKGEKIVQLMAGFIGDALIEDLPIPYRAVAVDIHRHQEVVFDSGPLMTAIRASISIPTVFMPVSFDHSFLIDGGVLNPLPLNVVQRKEGDLLVSVNVNSAEPYDLDQEEIVSVTHEQGYRGAREKLNQRWSELISREKKSRVQKKKEIGMFDVISESINLMQNRISCHSIEKYRPDICINLSSKIATIYDFYRAETLVEAGRIACRNALDRYNQSINS